MVHVLKSLTYFEDAEQEPMPDMQVPLAWDEVKQFIFREVLPLLGRSEVLVYEKGCYQLLRSHPGLRPFSGKPT